MTRRGWIIGWLGLAASAFGLETARVNLGVPFDTVWAVFLTMFGCVWYLALRVLDAEA